MEIWLRQYLLTEDRVGPEFPGSQGKEGNLRVPLFSMSENQFISRVLLVLDFIINSATAVLKMLEVCSVWTFIYLEKTESLNGTGGPVCIGVLVQPLPSPPR